MRIDHQLDPHALGLGGQMHDLDRRGNDFRQLNALHVEPHFSGNDAAHVQQIFDQLGLRRALRRMTSSPSIRSASLDSPTFKSSAQPRMALSGVRISCERLARNSSFARPMRSASARLVRFCDQFCVSVRQSLRVVVAHRLRLQQERFITRIQRMDVELILGFFNR